LEVQLGEARRELSERAAIAAAASARADEAEGARDAAAAEGRWLRVKLANEGEARREVEGRLAETAADAAAKVCDWRGGSRGQSPPLSATGPGRRQSGDAMIQPHACFNTLVHLHLPLGAVV
jgi:hypothetical protein